MNIVPLQNTENTREVSTEEQLRSVRPRTWQALELQTALSGCGIDVSEWGTGPTESFSHLLKSLNTQHVELRIEGHVATLHVFSAVLFVTCTKDDEVLELYEESHKFKNGTSKERPQFDGSIGETFERNETREAAWKRGLEEELHWHDPRFYKLWETGLQILGPMHSDKYSGIWSVFYRHKAACHANRILLRKLHKNYETNKVVILKWRPHQKTV